MKINPLCCLAAIAAIILLGLLILGLAAGIVYILPVAL